MPTPPPQRVTATPLAAVSAAQPEVGVAIAAHNTDIADGWERESYGEWYFEEFSTKSYRLGINIVIYALSH